ncbi:MAG TPA: hypothetical protein VLM85_32110 [Polyangiaceae bacterium]|nr:hypothetical protein [Polyangiaceae bacterium]
MWTAVGCAQERPAINQVQPNAMSKHFFVGADLSDPSDDPEFYMRNTVVDVPYGAAQDGLFTASYAQPLSRIKWEVQENALIARQTYEKIQNSDHNGSQTTNNGQVVAMFAIQSHFDIRRGYNPQTGEEINVIVENTTDRPWYQREYMRVDWSKNLVTDGYEVDTLSQLGIFGGVKFDPMQYQVTDPNDPNAPAFDMDTGYFDITTKAFASPQILTIPEWGVTFPACFFPADIAGGSYPVGNCNPTEITLRLSFKRVVDTDFEPTDWDGNKMNAFGWFTEDRLGYNRNYGVVDQDWHRWAAKYNIWQQSHIQGSQCAVDYWRDAKGNIQKYQTDGNGAFLTDPATGLPMPAAANDANAAPYPGTPVGADPHRPSTADPKTEAECAFTDSSGAVVHPGAYCDVATNKCALPFHERKLRTIPWYIGPDSAPDLFASTARALDQWNVAVKRAALIGQMVDAKRSGFDPNALITQADGSTLPVDALNGYPTEATIYADKSDTGQHTITNVFTLCHNPVIDSDDPACGPAGTKARVGDLRYNIVNIITNPQTPSPWGIMVDANDPLTGEKVQTSVNEWGHVLDLAAQGTEDLLRWINGEITDQQIASGAYLRDWVQASNLGTKPYQGKLLSADEIKSRLGSIDYSMSKLNGLTAADAATPPVLQRLKAAQNLANTLGPSLDNQYETFRNKAIGSEWETKLVAPNLVQAAGFDPSTPVAGNDTVVNLASPLRGMNQELRRYLSRLRGKTMSQLGYCQVEQPEPDSLVGLARLAQKLYPVPDNKDPNYPALKNKRDQSLHQWIREQFHVSVIAHEMGHSMGLRHNFVSNVDSLNYNVKYWQLRTRNGAEPVCQNLTTPNTDGKTCVGPRWMDPITDDEVNGLIWKWGATTVMDYPGDQTQDMNDIGNYDKAAMRFCYGQVADVDMDALQNNSKGQDYISNGDGFGGIAGQSMGGNHYTKYDQKYHILGTCSSPTDPSDLTTATCTGFKLDHVEIRDMQTVDQFGPTVTQVRPDLVYHFGVDPTTRRVRHPYMFGSDEFADFGNVPVYRFDSGADAYEQVQFLISTYENRYIFDNFRRDRVTFSSLGAINRAMDRYLDKVQTMVKSLALMVGLSGVTYATDPGQGMPLALAAPDVMAMFMRIATRPEPGPYMAAAGTYPLPFEQGEDINSLINNPDGDFKISLGSGEGRYIHNDYDYTKGYWWADYQTQVGTWYEKREALHYLTEAYNYFISNSKEDYIDGRYKNLNFASLYPHQMRRFLSAVMAGDPMALAPYVTIPSGNQGAVTPSVNYLPWEKETTALTYPAGATLVDPLVGWEMQYPGLFNTWWFGSTNLVSTTRDEMRIWSPGDVGTIDIAATDQIRYRDPVSGMIYSARTYGTEQVGVEAAAQRTVGARMLQMAQKLTDAAYNKCTSTACGGAAPIADPDGSGFSYQNYDTANPKDPAAAAKLLGYIANLDTARMLSKWVGTFEN